LRKDLATSAEDYVFGKTNLAKLVVAQESVPIISCNIYTSILKKSSMPTFLKPFSNTVNSSAKVNSCKMTIKTMMRKKRRKPKE